MLDIIQSFIHKVHSPQKLITYELLPRKTADFSSLLNELKASSLDKYVDGFILPDSPLAKLKHSSVLASIKTQQFFNKPALCTLSMRDKNSIALQSEILGLNEFDVRIFLAITGDKIHNGDQIQAKSVFEGNSNLLLDIINKLNHKTDINGAPLQNGNFKKIYGFCVSNSYANNLENLKNKMFNKISNGASALITQPVYDVSSADMLEEMSEEINATLKSNAKLIFGFFPLLSYKNALFLSEKLPGVYVPELYLKELKACKGEKDKEYKIGMELSKELFKSLYAKHSNIHFMNHNGFDNALKIITDS